VPLVIEIAVLEYLETVPYRHHENRVPAVITGIKKSLPELAWILLATQRAGSPYTLRRLAVGVWLFMPMETRMATSREAELLRQQNVLAQFGERALKYDDLDELLHEACRLVGDALGTDLAKVMELQSDGVTLAVRAGVGWQPGVVGNTTVRADENTSEGHAIRSGQSIVSADIDAEDRFVYPKFIRDTGVKALVNVIIFGADDKPPYGILQVDSREPRAFSQNDINFLRSYANLVAAAVERLRISHEAAQAQKSLRESENRYRAIVESAIDYAIITFDLSGRITGWNRAAQAILGWEESEILGQPTDVIFTAEDRAANVPALEMQKASSAGRAADERWHTRRDGTLFWASGQLTPLYGNKLHGYLKILRDHTEQRITAERLRASEERFRRLAEGIPQLVWRSRSSGERTWGSPQWTAYSGLSEAESLGLGWLDAVHPDDRAAAIAAWVEAGASGVFAADYRVRNAADSTYRWFQSRATPVRNDAGRIVEWLGTTTDIDDQVRAREVLARGQEELERLVAERTGDLARALDSLRIEAAERSQAEEALRQSQKMEAVGRLTGGIGHDFNNMLQGIAGSVEIARRRIREGRTADALRFLDTTRTAVDRAAALTHRLLVFARRQQLDPRPVDPDSLVAGMAELIRRTMGPGIRVELNLRDGAWNVLGDANELESALLNLCINARDAMPEGGRLTIGTSDAKLQPSDISEHDGAVPGDFVAISVTDTGEGMSPSVVARVFEPFFTTKPLGQGTGLGLSQVYGFVRQSNGIVQIDSTPNEGTTVRLCLPRHDGAEVPVDQMPPPAPDQAQAGETVLLVDDEDGVREPACEHLRELGYKVLEAPDGPTALRIVGDMNRLDLLVTDVGLPNGMNGRQVAESVRQRWPGLPVLFITGYAGTALAPGTEVVRKPFDLDSFARRIQSMLAQDDRQPHG
jgi:PAS domain S-box-containing protein